MADSAIRNGDPNTLLKPYHQRASEAEERLLKLEATLSKKQGIGGNPDAGNSELVTELQSKLEKVTAELASEQEKVAKLTGEVTVLTDANAKKVYRIIHLLHSLRELDPQSK